MVESDSLNIASENLQRETFGIAKGIYMRYYILCICITSNLPKTTKQ